MKTALITGIAGQDGSYLASLLVEKGYAVYGITKPRTPLHNLSYHGIRTRVSLIEGDITDPASVGMALKVVRPDEIYNLAAQTHVGYSFKAPQMTASTNYMGFLNVLLEARKIVPKARIYQAGTSEMFGYSMAKIANEDTPLQPMSPYAVAKTAAHWAAVNARAEADQFVSNGILFNHESPIRPEEFVSRKICKAVAEFHMGREAPLRMGNIDSIRDWGFAGDYVEAMWLMLQHDRPDDFVVATGECSSVRNFLIQAFKYIGMDLRFEGAGMDEKGYVGNRLVVVMDEKFYRPNDLKYLCGDSAKARNVLGWMPKVSFNALVRTMVDHELRGPYAQ